MTAKGLIFQNSFRVGLFFLDWRRKALRFSALRLLAGLEWDELLNEALLRALDGRCRWPEGVPLLAFLAGIIMRSLVDARAHERRRLAEHALASGEAHVTAPPNG
jgi:RNA polymerase sigma-70 factor (ECF subfamily)